jgi:7-cyano-7-deazaguanine synthase in queuosine biosynthesis
MSVAHYELLAPQEAATVTGADHLWWPAKGQQTDIRTGLDWDLTVYGEVSDPAADLLHIAAAAYLADLRTRRPTTFSRQLAITVHVHNPTLWTGPAGEILTDLLAWVSGDEWTLHLVALGKHTAAPDTALTPPHHATTDTMLLSGGLDSFCGAVDHLATATDRVHIGHRDSATSVKHAQRTIHTWLTTQVPEFTWMREELRPRPRKRENTTRTRSLLFMAMAIAAADGTKAPSVIVPENGYTSLNLPLAPSRGGALSTKSTHPWTFHLINQALQHAGISVEVTNPYLHMTKGELLKQALATAPDGFLDTTKDTLSCAKLDSGRVKKALGGDPNINCGLCYACLVRRGSYVGAGVTDPTDYLVNRLTTKTALTRFRNRRHDDLWALELAQKRTLTEDDLIASASWPPGYDITAALGLVNRGRQELFSVPLPT